MHGVERRDQVEGVGRVEGCSVPNPEAGVADAEAPSFHQPCRHTLLGDVEFAGLAARVSHAARSGGRTYVNVVGS